MFWDKPTIRQFFREQGNWPELRIRNSERRTTVLNAPAQPDDPDILAEIVRRRRQWLAPREERGGDLPAAAELILTPVVIGLAATIAEKRVWQVLLIAGAVFFAIRIGIIVRRRQRVQEALIDGLCPDCGYECRLSGAGPPVCPECGSAWPLVPPERRRIKMKTSGEQQPPARLRDRPAQRPGGLDPLFRNLLHIAQRILHRGAVGHTAREFRNLGEESLVVCAPVNDDRVVHALT